MQGPREEDAGILITVMMSVLVVSRESSGTGLDLNFQKVPCFAGPTATALSFPRELG